MTASDLIAIVSIVGSCSIAAYSAWLYRKSRVDAIGEHLYAQQLDYLKEIKSRFAETIILGFLEIEVNDYKEKDFLKVQLDLERIEVLIEAKGFLLPNSLVTAMNVCLDETSDYLDLVYKKKEAITKDDSNEMYYSYFDMEDRIRDFVGVYKLSK